MALPFDVANFNLVNFADNYNNIFDSTPADVQIQVKDSNGNITTKTVANRGKFQQQVWDDVGGALGQFDRTFFVDAVNGSDLNTGGQSDPFKTILQAISSIPVGGKGYIWLHGDQTFIINEIKFLHNRSIVCRGDWNVSNSKAVVTNEAYIDANNGKQYTYGLSPSLCNFRFQNCTIQTADLVDNTQPLNSFHGFFRKNGGGEENFAVSLYGCDLKLGDTNLIQNEYSIGSNVYMYNCSVDCVGANQNSILLNTNMAASSLIAIGVTLGTKNDGTTALSWTDIIAGVQKDANGAYKNILTNLDI